MRNRMLLLVVLALVGQGSTRAQTPIARSFNSEFGAYGFIVGGAVPALQGFDVAFTNGDHKLRDLNVAPLAGSSYLILLKDSAGADPIAGSIKLMDVREFGGARRVSRPDCVARCRINLPSVVPRDQALVLLGFDFHYSLRDGGPDTNIREISVEPWPRNAYVEVVFADSAGARPYHAQVDYTLVPVGVLAFHDRSVSAPAPIRGSQTLIRPRGAALLQAFRFRFTESDHFLHRFRIDLTDDRIRVSFHDRDFNDPYLWSIKFAVLR
jgi:hypothetical protein